jgi:hypothetical protein
MTRELAFSILRPPKLSRTRRLLVYGIGTAVWLTGALWVVLHYFFMRQGPFGSSPHPLEFWSLVSHGAAAFASLWLFGLLWGVHVPIGWRMARRRWSGGAVFGLTVWLIVSGYMLYYVGIDEVMSVVGILHWSLGLAAPAFFLLHRFARERRRGLITQIVTFDMSYDRPDT